MAGEKKGVRVNAAIEHDGKRYAPGMLVPVSKAAGEDFTERHGAWEGEPVEGNPVDVRRATPRQRVSRLTSSETFLPKGSMVVSKDDLAAIVSEAVTAVVHEGSIVVSKDDLTAIVGEAVTAALPSAVQTVLEVMTEGADDDKEEGSADLLTEVEAEPGAPEGDEGKAS